jgi:hypothetical protein
LPPADALRIRQEHQSPLPLQEGSSPIKGIKGTWNERLSEFHAGWNCFSADRHSVRNLHGRNKQFRFLGFVLMTVFGIVYRMFPDMAASGLSKVHFWLHAIGAAVLLVMLFGLLSGRISEAGMTPVAPIAEFAILIGIICFAWNLLQNGK